MENEILFVTRKINLAFNDEKRTFAISSLNIKEFEDEVRAAGFEIIRSSQTISVQNDVSYITYQAKRLTSTGPIKEDAKKNPLFIIKDSTPWNL